MVRTRLVGCARKRTTAAATADWRESCCHLNFLFARVSAPIAAKNGDGASVVNHVREPAQVRIRRTKHRRRRDADIHWFAHGLRRRDIPWNREYRRAFLKDRSAYGCTDDGLSQSRID